MATITRLVCAMVGAGAVISTACGGSLPDAGSPPDQDPPGGDEDQCPSLTDPGGTVIDWVHFINVAGVQYIANRDGRELQASDLGPAVATVQCRRSEAAVDVRQPARDGDAAFLPVGTEIYALAAYDPAFRLAARHEGRIELFEADSNPNARTGRDLLDLAGQVARLSVNSATDGVTELTSITDPEEVAVLVRMVLQASVDQTEIRAGGQRYFIAFHLTDGTVVRRSYWLESGELSRGILLPDTFRVAIVEALAR